MDYVFADLTPAINIYIDAAETLLRDTTGKPMFNIKIANNRICDAKTAAIGVQYARDIEIYDNIIERPMAAELQTAYGNVMNYPYPSAVYLNAVANASVRGNRITLKDPKLIPEVQLQF